MARDCPQNQSDNDNMHVRLWHDGLVKNVHDD